MKTKIIKEDILKAVNIVTRLISTRTTLPILQNIYLCVDNNKLELRTTDLEQTISVIIDSTESEGGSITAPSRLITDYLQNTTDTQLTLTETGTNSLVISGKNSKAKIRAMSAEEYPVLPEIKIKEKITLNAEKLVGVLKNTVFATANDETRPTLTGLLFRVQGGKLTVVGTDGYRLAKEEIDVETSFSGDLIIPRRAVIEIIRLLGSGEMVIGISGTQLEIMYGNVRFITRVIDGSFPNFEGIIPKKNTYTFSANCAALVQSLKVASTFSRDSSYSTKISFTEGKMLISANSPVLGEANSSVDIEGASIPQDVIISFNAQYLLDPLLNIGDEVVVEITDSKSPIVVKNPQDSNFLYLLMPLRSD